MELFRTVLQSIFFLLLIIIYLGSIYDLYKAISTRKWKRIRAEVDNAFIAIQEDTDGKTFEAEILYSYVINGTKYESSDIGHLGFFSLSRAYAKKIMDECLSKDFFVFVNPKNNREAVIKTGFQRGHIFSTIYVVLGSYVVLSFLVGVLFK